MQPELTALRNVTGMTKKLCPTGKRNAVGNKSRSTVANSALVLRRPTSPSTAGRSPAASPPSTLAVDVGVGVDVAVGVDLGVGVISSQLKSWDFAQSNSPNVLAARSRQLDELDIGELRKFFELLDEWERRAFE
jgi:hypothetical protein